jgi:hypothetical protein
MQSAVQSFHINLARNHRRAVSFRVFYQSILMEALVAIGLPVSSNFISSVSSNHRLFARPNDMTALVARNEPRLAAST